MSMENCISKFIEQLTVKTPLSDFIGSESKWGIPPSVSQDALEYLRGGHEYLIPAPDWIQEVFQNATQDELAKIKDSTSVRDALEKIKKLRSAQMQGLADSGIKGSGRKQRSSKLTEEEQERRIKIAKRTTSVRSFSRAAGISEATSYAWLNKNGFRYQRKYATKEEIKAMIAWAPGHTIMEVSRHFNSYPSTVRNALLRNGYTTTGYNGVIIRGE